MKTKETVEEIISYRTAIRVTECITYDKCTSFPICPKCDCALEREYQSYCDRCGQKLSWVGYLKAKVRYVEK